MGKDTRSYQEKKRFSIVHKPFSTGKINLFNPPKKNPNGHLASAKLWDEELEPQLSEPLLETEEPPEPEVPRETVTGNWISNWKISAIFLVLLAHLIAAIALVLHEKNNQIVATTLEKNSRSYISGKTDLTAREFQQLNLNNLKNITNYKKEQNSQNSTEQNLDNSDNLPLAIPPTNLPSDIILPELKTESQYYYILASYNGDRSLELAKTKVPHVSLVNFPQGVFIYMGAFTKKELALDFINNLKQTGLESYIYPFD